MQIIVKWKISRTSILPILELEGETDKNSDIAKMVAIENALSILSKAEQYGGRVYQRKPKKAETKTIMIQFSLIFKKEKDLERFVNSNH